MASPSPDHPAQPPRTHITAVLILLAATAVVYLVRLDTVAGLIGDDAWYVVLAKAIADGHGPRLISSAGPHIVSPVYPPGFPGILAAVFLIAPDFPANVYLLKLLSVAAVAGAGVLTYLLALRRVEAQSTALFIALATVLSPSLVFLVTSTLMSEGVFLFVLLSAVLLIERAVIAPPRKDTALALASGVFLGAALLLRTASISLVAAAFVYLAWKRRWRALAWCMVTTCVVALPWAIYSRVNRAADADRTDHGGLMAVDYAEHFWRLEAGTVTSSVVGAAALPARVWRNITNIAIRDMGGLFVPSFFRTSSESGLELIGLGPPERGAVPSMGSALATKVFSAGLALLACVGFVHLCRTRLSVAEPLIVLSLGLTVLWPFWTFRFVLPLVPLLLIYMVTGLDVLLRLLLRGDGTRPVMAASAVRVFLLVLIGLNVLDHTGYVVAARSNPRGAPWQAHAADMDHVFTWIREHGAEGAVVAADNPALVHLRTGHPTVALNSFGDPWARWRKMNVRYLVSLSDGQLIDDPARTALRFKLEDRNIWVVELLPEPTYSPAMDEDGSSTSSATHMPERGVR